VPWATRPGLFGVVHDLLCGCLQVSFRAQHGLWGAAKEEVRCGAGVHDARCWSRWYTWSIGSRVRVGRGLCAVPAPSAGSPPVRSACVQRLLPSDEACLPCRSVCGWPPASTDGCAPHDTSSCGQHRHDEQQRRDRAASRRNAVRIIAALADDPPRPDVDHLVGEGRHDRLPVGVQDRGLAADLDPASLP
jgi:hypothetical protein